MLSLTCEEMDDGALTRVEFTEERLERAKKRLAEVDVVGVQEDFEGFCAELSSRFGWTFPASALRVERTRRPSSRPTFRERILDGQRARRRAVRVRSCAWSPSELERRPEEADVSALEPRDRSDPPRGRRTARGRDRRPPGRNDREAARLARSRRRSCT